MLTRRCAFATQRPGDTVRQSIDIVFVVPDGGQPGSAGFQADAHRRAIDECAALGVTGNNVTLDTTSLEHTLDVIGRYGADVIIARSS